MKKKHETTRLEYAEHVITSPANRELLETDFERTCGNIARNLDVDVEEVRKMTRDHLEMQRMKEMMGESSKPASSQEDVMRIAYQILEHAVTHKFAVMIMADIGTGLLNLFKPGRVYTETDVRELIGEVIFNLVMDANRYQTLVSDR